MTADRWRTLALVGRWIFAALFVAGGVGHFVKTDVYMRIMPPYLPYHRALVLLGGVFEIVLCILLLVPPTSRLAAWGLRLLCHRPTPLRPSYPSSSVINSARRRSMAFKRVVSFLASVLRSANSFWSFFL